MKSTRSRRRLAQVLVCTGCCCGRREQGRAPVPVTWLRESWVERALEQTIGLSITNCLGPCDRGNVVCLKLPTTTTWIGGLGEPAQYEALLAWVTESQAADRLIPLPGLLDQQRFDQPGNPDSAARAFDTPEAGEVAERELA